MLVQTPLGTLKREWLKDGTEIPLETPPEIETIPKRERFVFRRWERQPGLVSPKITGIANGPVTLRAVYGREFMVTVTTPYGAAGGGWYAEGATAAISVLSAVQNKFVFKRSFVSFPGQSASGPNLQLLVREATAVNALYRTGVDLKVLGPLVAVPLELGLLYLIAPWLFAAARPSQLRRQAMRSAAQRPPPRGEPPRDDH